MIQTVFANVSKHLWHSHEQVKRLLLFAIPTKKNAEALRKESNSNESASNSPNDPGQEGNEPSPYKTHQKIGLLLGPILFTLTLLFFSPEGLSSQGLAVLAITLWVATWWITEAIPIPATSLMPIILLPITGALETGTVTASYGDPIIFLFLGGFLIALAMEKWMLHKRIALTIIQMIGTSTKQIVLGFMIATAFLSLWISNTAAVMMMIPIGTAITYQAAQALKRAGNNSIEDEERFNKGMILGIGYAGTIGGLGTLIGTPPNIILAGTVERLFGYQISFAEWMFFALPLVVLMIVLAWVYLVTIAYPTNIKQLPGGKELILKEKKALGPASFEEKMVFSVFVFAAFMWITRTFFWQEGGLIIAIPNINDTMIAIFAGLLLFLIPSRSKRGTFLLDWTVSKEIPWGIFLLFGGGLAIASGFQESGLADWIGNQLTILDGVSMLLMITVTTLLIMFLTEITSNTATATMILPIVAALALAVNVHPLALMVPAAMAANCAFMLPVGTPPNAIVFSTGKVTIGNMVRAGFWVNVVATIIIIFAVYLYLPLVMGIDLSTFPTEWRS
ncbi:SLC13 family permease [Halalkalibacterium ligniniphilum]|uniref:SLC13 family permease n=1 Tax=Halalkalibacterium ligniniphilum TaxID=1134413 RepID=UPI000345E074|nr:DASS family sodium-coupled anion symporter [Halalkalibacterium ligniniphilum]